MYLKELRLQGFKSFANPTTLKFTRELTAIVGPNGSGKSNVADGVRWVLGEQSSKLLRGKSSADVIFAGSSSKARLGFAEVSMVIDNAEGRMPIDYPEVVITRRVYRDGNSEYEVNKNPVRLADIVTLLAQSGFGQKSYSVIGQGMIEDVLVAPAAQRKEFFDEATGVKQFQLKRDDSENKLKKTKENLLQAENLLAEIEPRLKSLQRQVAKREKRDQVAGELVEVQLGYYAYASTALRKEHENTLSDVESKRAKVKQHEAIVAEKRRSVESEQAGLGASADFLRLQKEFEQLMQKRSDLQKQKSVLEGQKELAARAAGKEQVIWLEQQIAHWTEQEQVAARELEVLRQEVADAEAIVRTQDASYARVLQLAADIEAQLASVQKAVEHTSPVTPHAVVGRISATRSALVMIVEKMRTASPETMPMLIDALSTLAGKLGEIEGEITGVAPQTDTERMVSLQQELSAALQEKEAVRASKEQALATVSMKQQALQSVQRRVSEASVQLKKFATELQLAAVPEGNDDERKELLDKEIANVVAQLQEQETVIVGVRGQLDMLAENEAQKRTALATLQRELSDAQDSLRFDLQILSDAEVALARIETRVDELQKEIQNELGDVATRVAESEVQSIDAQETQRKIHRLKEQLAQIGAIDESVLEEHQLVSDRFTFLSGQVEDLRAGIADLEKVIEQLDATIRKQFSSNFKNIKTKFEEYFEILFHGGKATLTILEEEPQKVEGVQAEGDEEGAEGAQVPEKKTSGEKIITGVGVKATPPGKKLDDVTALSGGERAMTAIALICAIIANNPSPFVILDEVDAALDEANSDRFASIIAQLAHKTQFVCITHNRATMRQAAILYGVTMGGDGISSLLSINLKQAEEVAQ